MDEYFWNDPIIVALLRDQALKSSGKIHEEIFSQIRIQWLSCGILELNSNIYEINYAEKSLLVSFNPNWPRRYFDNTEDDSLDHHFLSMETHILEEIVYLKIFFKKTSYDIEIQVYRPVRIFQNFTYLKFLQKYIEENNDDYYACDISPQRILFDILNDKDIKFVERREGFKSKYLIKDIALENIGSRYDVVISRLYDNYQNKEIKESFWNFEIQIDFRHYGL